MNYEQIESARASAGMDMLKKIGETFGRAQSNLQERMSDPGMRKQAAARVSLEYAVLATARERGVATELVANALPSASVSQQSMLIKEGRAAIGRSFGVEPEVLVSTFAGKMVAMEMPKGMGTTPEYDKMIDAARNLVTAIVKEDYAQRGRFNASANDRDGYVRPSSDGLIVPIKTQLATRMAFMESSIDAGVSKGHMTAANAQMFKERIEAQVFQPRPPQSIEFSAQFRAYFESRGKDIEAECMKDVRGVTQSQTVREIAQKLSLVMPSSKPDPVRIVAALER